MCQSGNTNSFSVYYEENLGWGLGGGGFFGEEAAEEKKFMAFPFSGENQVYTPSAAPSLPAPASLWTPPQMQQQLPKAPRRPRSDKGKKHNQDHKALVGRISAFMDRNDILYHGAKTVRVPARSGSGFNFFSTSKKGLPDILVLEPSKVNQMHGLAIEVKVGMDKMKPEQIKFFKRLRQRGWRCSPPSPPLASLPCPIHPNMCRCVEVRDFNIFKNLLQEHVGSILLD